VCSIIYCQYYLLVLLVLFPNLPYPLTAIGYLSQNSICKMTGYAQICSIKCQENDVIIDLKNAGPEHDQDLNYISLPPQNYHDRQTSDYSIANTQLLSPYNYHIKHITDELHLLIFTCNKCKSSPVILFFSQSEDAPGLH